MNRQKLNLYAISQIVGTWNKSFISSVAAEHKHADRTILAGLKLAAGYLCMKAINALAYGARDLRVVWNLKSFDGWRVFFGVG